MHLENQSDEKEKDRTLRNTAEQLNSKDPYVRKRINSNVPNLPC